MNSSRLIPAMVVSAILVLAAFMKIWLAVESFAHFDTTATGAITFALQLGIATFELFVAIVLWRYPDLSVMWLLTAVMFFVFSVLNTYEHFTQWESCSCFGTIYAKPLQVAILDLALFVIAAGTCVRTKGRMGIAKLGSHAAFALLMAVSLCTAGFAREKILPTSMSLATPLVARLELGDYVDDSSQWRNGTLVFANRGPARIVGVFRSCGVQLPMDAPIEFDGSESLVKVPALLKVARSHRGVVVVFTLYVEDAGVLREQTMRLRVRSGGTV